MYPGQEGEINNLFTPFISCGAKWGMFGNDRNFMGFDKYLISFFVFWRQM